MSDEKIRVATSIPSLKDKIQINISPGDLDAVYWYIRFNIPLDESSVSYRTMDVTDTLGYIMRTDISYDAEKNMIVISPIDSYEQGIFYLLNISKKVRSAKGQYLRSKIHILFKLVGNQISDFKILKSNVQVPEPRKRPKDYDRIVKQKLYSFDQSVINSVPQDKLPFKDIKVNLVPAVLGLIAVLTNIYLMLMPLWIVGVLLCLAGTVIIFTQISKPEQRSALKYNRGVGQFNRENYEKAQKLFKMALAIDEQNELAEFALNKVSYYL